MPQASPEQAELHSGDTAELWRLAVDSLPSGVAFVRSNGTVIAANRPLLELLGYGREELVGKPIEVVFPGGIGDLREDAGLFSRTLVARRQDHSEVPLDVRFRLIRRSHGTDMLLSLAPSSESRRQPVLAIQERLEFEQLVAQLSVSFINLPADEVADAIGDALRKIGESLAIDRCTFYRIGADGVLFDPIRWTRPGCSPSPAPIDAGHDFPWAIETIRAGRVLCFSSLDEVPSAVDRENYRAVGVRSSITIPLSVSGRVVGAVGFNHVSEARQWDPETVHRLTVIAAAFGNVLARQESERALTGALAEVRRLRDQLQAENLYLRREVEDRLGTGPIVGHSAAIQQVLLQVRQVAATDSTVLLLGETGTGKELFATHIHEQSPRRGRPMIRVNCAAIPSTLIESELFGREKGAFTGALARQVGRFELADHSTIFLDEIGDLPAEVQVKLLRVLEEREIERLGSPRTIRINTRIVAATHRNLEQLVAAGTFREDLYYRMNVFPIHVPPLRERAEDIPLLVWRFVDEFSKSFGRRVEGIPRESMTALQEYSWPGNIRELRNVVERAMITAQGSRLRIAVPAAAATAAPRSSKLTDVEREHIRSVLQSTSWRIRGSGGAADRLGLRPTTLETRMAKLGLTRPRP